nr:NAD(P)H-binding protein [uncultured Pedobacter sp.]
MKKAILFGATGFVGSALLCELLNNSEYNEVTVVVRKDLNISHPKLKVLIGGFSAMPKLIETVVVDEIFISLGAIQNSSQYAEEYYQIDHDYPVIAAKTAKQNGAKSVFLVTAAGANPNSRLKYVKTKGETERDIIALDFQYTHIFRPTMIVGNRPDKRPFEKIGMKVWKLIHPIFIGRQKNYHEIDGKDIAKAMNNATSQQSEKVKIYNWKEMMAVLRFSKTELK